MQPFSPIHSDHLWIYFTEFDYTDAKITKYYLPRIMKYYVKAYFDIVKKMIEDHREIFNKYFQEYDNYEKVLIAWVKDKHLHAIK